MRLIHAAASLEGMDSLVDPQPIRARMGGSSPPDFSLSRLPDVAPHRPMMQILAFKRPPIAGIRSADFLWYRRLCV